MKPVDPELGLVERSDLVKGYEYEDKQYIIIDDADLEAVRIESNHTMNIEAFVDEDEVDVIYQDAPYYLAPDGAMAEETFVVLREAMRRSGKLAIARLVLSSRERVVTIGARENGMFVCTLRNPSEVRGTAEYFGNIPVGKPEAEMLDLAEKLIEQKVTKFDPKAYEDRYEVALMADDPRKAQGPQADHRRRARARQCRQPDGCAEGEPRPGQARRRQQEQGRCTRPSRQEAVAEGSGRGLEGRRCQIHRQARRSQKEGLITAMRKPDTTFGIVGALSAFPRRLAARALQSKGGRLRRGITRHTKNVVIGRDAARQAPRRRNRAPPAGARRVPRHAAERERLPPHSRPAARRR